MTMYEINVDEESAVRIAVENEIQGLSEEYNALRGGGCTPEAVGVCNVLYSKIEVLKGWLAKE